MMLCHVFLIRSYLRQDDKFPFFGPNIVVSYMRGSGVNSYFDQRNFLSSDQKSRYY